MQQVKKSNLGDNLKDVKFGEKGQKLRMGVTQNLKVNTFRSLNEKAKKSLWHRENGAKSVDYFAAVRSLKGR